MKEMYKLHAMLLDAGISHTFNVMPVEFFGAGALQIRVYRDDTFQEELDDVVFHKYSHGYERGLLETFRLNGCVGFETAEEVFNGWMKEFFYNPLTKN